MLDTHICVVVPFIDMITVLHITVQVDGKVLPRVHPIINYTVIPLERPKACEWETSVAVHAHIFTNTLCHADQSRFQEHRLLTPSHHWRMLPWSSF